MIARAQQRDKGRRNRGHAGGKAHRADAVLHLAHLRFQRGGGGVALAAIGVAGGFALEHTGQLARVGIAERHRSVHRLVYRIMLDRRFQIGMQYGRGKSVLRHVIHKIAS